MQQLVIANATVIDATGSAPQENCAVFIDEHGNIANITDASSPEVREHVRIYDAQGAYMVPGLMDANVHTVAARTPDSLLEYEGRYETLVLEAAQLLLKYGVTTVFDSWAPVGPVVNVRDAIQRGDERGARIFCAGNILGLGGPLSDDFFGVGNVLSQQTITRINKVWERGTGARLSSLTAEEVGDVVAEYIETTNVDFIKWAATDHRPSTSGVLYMLGDRAQRQIAETARSYGKTFQAHTTTVESLRLLTELDASVLQHGDITLDQPAPSCLIEEIAEKQLATAALIVTDRHLQWSHEHVSHTDMHRMRVIADINQRALIDARAPLLLTTDGFAYGPDISNHPGFRVGTLKPEVPDLPVQLGYSHVFWMEGAIERGLNYMDVLQAATRNIAQAYDIADEVGTIETGKRADLLLLNSNPLENVAAYRDIRDVFQRGVLVERGTLATDLQLGLDVYKYLEHL